MGCVKVGIKRIGGDSIVNTTRAKKLCVVKTSLVCSINILKNYIRVEPEYLWLTESNQFRDIVNVYSDIAWKAE